MNASKIFILIVILVTIGAATFVIDYIKQPIPEIQSIRLRALIYPMYKWNIF